MKQGVRCYIFKHDLCWAYPQFLVDLLDYPLLGYLQEDLFYFGTALPMGIHSYRPVNGLCRPGVIFENDQPMTNST